MASAKTSSVKRRIAARLLWCCVFLHVHVGCHHSTLTPSTGDLRRDLGHSDPRIRIDASLEAVHEKRRDLAFVLVENLADSDGAVRLFSAVALRKLTGKRFDYKPHGTLAERTEAAARWRSWLHSQESSRAPEGPSAPPVGGEG